MKKKKIIMALLICTFVSVQAKANALSHETNVPEVNNKTYDSYVTNGSGGAISNAIASTIKASTFSNNQSLSNGSGGSIDINTTSGNLTQITDSTFNNNYSSWAGGAISQRRNAGELKIDGGSFTNNSSKYEGGALFLGAQTSVNSTISNVLFEGNEALSTNWNDKYSTADDGGGGAIFVGSAAKVSIENSDFKNNISNTEGGAIAVRSDSVNDGRNSLSVKNSNFVGNSATKDGGAIASFIDVNVSNSTFDGNKSSRNGGAVSIDLTKSGNSTGSTFNNVTFKNDNATKNGGAIYSTGAINVDNSTFSSNSTDYASGGGGAAVFLKTEKGINSEIKNSTFENNTNMTTSGTPTETDGGAITLSRGDLTVESTKFNNNKSDTGGAIYVRRNDDANLIVNNSEFNNNEALSYGAVANFNNATISNTTFKENKALTATGFQNGGGAFFAGATSNSKLINDTFISNTSASSGGAIGTRSSSVANNSKAVLDIENSTFTGNKAATTGGAIDNYFYNSNTKSGAVTVTGSTFTSNEAADGGGIYNHGTADNSGKIADINISNSAFEGNKATTGSGGAVYNAGTLDGITSSSFKNNSAAVNGGAIYTDTDVTLTDSSLTGNTAGTSGGAIYAKSDVTINATNSNVTLSGNSASDGSGDIYMATAGKNLNINAAENKSVTLASGISGSGTYNMNVNKNAADTGSLVVASQIQNAAISVDNGSLHLAQGSSLNNSTITMNNGTTLNTINNSTETLGAGILTVNGNVNVNTDVNLSNGSADNFSNATLASGAKLKVTQIHTIGSTTANNASINLAQALGVDPASLDLSNVQTDKILTPIRYLQGSVENNMLNYTPTGNGYRDFNPSIMASSVAAQMGGYLSQLNSYDQAFMNLDMRMLLTQSERKALREQNSYAAMNSPVVYSPIYRSDEEKGGWARPYSSFENVRLKNGPKVNNVMYGSFFGADSDMYELKNGAEVQYSVYAGYNGSHQTYDGVGLYQNGGNLGATAILYKGNFFTALTANAGASSVEANTMYGNDNFTMLMAGAASKTGYNWELAKGKFIIQPNYLMSYTFVNTFDYTNAAGVRITSDPLNAIQIAPGVKFIGNLKNGWQPYASVSMIWNIMDKSKFTAAETALPELSVKPYVEYGLGIQKRWGERFIGFFQTMFRGGGRNGVAFSLGFRFAIGKEPKKTDMNTQKNVLKMQQPKIKLSYTK